MSFYKLDQFVDNSGRVSVHNAMPFFCFETVNPDPDPQQCVYRIQITVCYLKSYEMIHSKTNHIRVPVCRDSSSLLLNAAVLVEENCERIMRKMCCSGSG
jgi:hypothetical protein